MADKLVQHNVQFHLHSVGPHPEIYLSWSLTPCFLCEIQIILYLPGVKPQDYPVESRLCRFHPKIADACQFIIATK